MMTISLKFIILFSTINLIETIKFLPIVNIPKADIIINPDKAIVLERIGTYASQLKEEIVHSIIPVDIPCTKLSTTGACSPTSGAEYPNILEMSVTLPSRDVVTPLPRYHRNYVSNLIRKDINRILHVHRPDQFIAQSNATIHLINNQFLSANQIQQTLLDSTDVSIDINKSDTQKTLLELTTIIRKQVYNDKIGFQFLTDTELKSFLSAVASVTDQSYQVIDLAESLRLFSQIIIAQSIYFLHSCSNLGEHTSSRQSCVIISTIFLRPLIENDNLFSVYRLNPLPAIVNNEQFIYSNMPEAIGINAKDQRVMLWDSIPKDHDCLFSIFIYCQQKVPFIRLSSSPCLSELFDDNTNVASSCQITRSHKIQTDIINIARNIWLFSHKEESLFCQLKSDTGDYNSLIVINEPSIVHLTCGNTMKCPSSELLSSTCSNHYVLIKSSVTGNYEQLTTVPASIKTMTNQLLSAYRLTIKNSFKDILHDLENNRLTITMIIKQFGGLISSVLFLLFLSFLVFFIRWIKCLVQKRMDKIEKDFDDLVHELV